MFKASDGALSPGPLTVASAPSVAVDASRFGVDPMSGSDVPETMVDADDSSVPSLISRASAQLLTGPGGDLAVSLVHREVVAYLSDATMLVSQDDLLDPIVVSLWQQIYASGRRVANVLYVPPGLLAQVYDASEQHFTRSGGVRTQTSEAERKLSDCLRAAAAVGASDIHVVLTRYATQVLMRVDGFLEPYERLSRPLGLFLVRVAYLMSDDSEGGSLRHGEYQSARISGGKLVLPEGVQSLRLQFNPTSNRGYYLVLRLLYADSQAAGRDVDRLGYASFHLDSIRVLRARPSGLNIVSGVTGSGKSTTLQRLLRALLEEHHNRVNMITIEDPPEYEIPGARQFPVLARSEEREDGFVQAISAAMRSDPDVLMVGEIRDYATAHLAVKCANTGHQVWTTVHATDALRSASRLIEEGIPRHRLMDPGVLSSLIGQRLVRVLCQTCSLDWESACDRGIYDSRPGFVDRLTAYFEPLDPSFLRDHVRVCASADADPCPDSGSTCRAGYAGRTLVAEVVPVDEALIDAFTQGAGTEGLSVANAERFWIDQCNGVRMREHAFMKLIGGQLDPLDVEDVVGLVSFAGDDRFDHLVALAAREGYYEARGGGAGAGRDILDLGMADLDTEDGY